MLGATLHVLLCGDVRVRGVDREGYGLLQDIVQDLLVNLWHSDIRFRPGIDGVLV